MATSVELFDVLRRDIISGRYQPMHLFDPRLLSSEYLISVAPIREAMLRLSERGLVRWERNRGFFVEKVSSSTALFHLDQLRSHYVYAIGRLKDRRIILNGDGDGLIPSDNIDVGSYISWQDLLSKEIFSDAEREFVRGAWDRIWAYRNRYLEDSDIRAHLYNSSCDLIKLLNEKEYDECIKLADSLFRYVMARFPDFLSSMGD